MLLHDKNDNWNVDDDENIVTDLPSQHNLLETSLR